MNKARAALLVLTVVLLATGVAYAQTGERFGPWLYYAPYYFPQGGLCKGYCLSPDDFVPRYEDPNPEAPAPVRPLPPRKRIRKTHRGHASLAAPSVRVRSVRPTISRPSRNKSTKRFGSESSDVPTVRGIKPAARRPAPVTGANPKLVEPTVPAPTAPKSVSPPPPTHPNPRWGAESKSRKSLQPPWAKASPPENRVNITPPPPRSGLKPKWGAQESSSQSPQSCAPPASAPPSRPLPRWGAQTPTHSQTLPSWGAQPTSKYPEPKPIDPFHRRPKVMPLCLL